MNMDKLITQNELLIEENKKLKDELMRTKEQLRSYTDNSKRYYEKNKEEIIQKVKEYQQNPNYVRPNISKEVIKERNKRAYLKRKEKLKELENQNI